MAPKLGFIDSSLSRMNRGFSTLYLIIGLPSFFFERGLIEMSKLIRFIVIYLVNKLYTKHSTTMAIDLVSYLSSKYTPTRQEVVTITNTVNTTYTRMDSQVYERFEQLVGSNSRVTSTTSDIESGFKLGVNHVLHKLRAGYVVETSNT